MKIDPTCSCRVDIWEMSIQGSLLSRIFMISDPDESFNPVLWRADDWIGLLYGPQCHTDAEKHGPQRAYNHLYHSPAGLGSLRTFWQVSYCRVKSLWRHDLETFSAFLALCEGNPPVTGGFPSQRDDNVDKWCIIFYWQEPVVELIIKLPVT